MKTKRKFNALTKSALSVALVLIMLVCAFPLTAFAADDTTPRYTIIDDPFGNAISTDPKVVKVDNEYFSEPLAYDEDGGIATASAMSRSAVPEVIKGTFTADENYDFSIASPVTLGNGDTLTWSSSNTFLATVDSAGYVYTNTAGNVKIYATVTLSNGNQTRYVYNVIIQFPEGVYKFKNSSTNKYIELPAGDISEGVEYIQWTEESNRNSLFKITIVGPGVYTIRSMVANNVGFARSSTDMLANADIGTSNDEDYIDSYHLWGIASNVNGYYIYNYSGANGRYTITPTSTGAGYDCKFTLTYHTSTATQYWNIIYQNFFDHGVDIRTSADTVGVGEEFRFIATMYSWYPQVNGQHEYVWTVTNGTGSATINSYTGGLIGESIGNVTVNVDYRYGSNIIGSASCNVEIIPLSESIHFFRNKETDKYMQPDNDGNAHMEQHDFDGSAAQRWNLVYLGNGYYHIINDDSGLYLTATSTNVDGETVYQQVYNSGIASRQKWKFTLLSNGSYKVQSQIGESESLVLAVGWGADWNGINIEQREFNESDTNHKDEWIVLKYRNNITREIQEQDQWCWAACVRMMSMQYVESPISQASLAVYVKCGIETSSPSETQIAEANEPATISESCDALEYLIGEGAIFCFNGIYSEWQLRSLLDSSNPVMILRNSFELGIIPTGGHYYVIYDYHWDESKGMYLYDIYNPAQHANEIISVSYQALCDGEDSAFEGDMCDDRRWTGIVTYKIGNYILMNVD